MAVQNKLRAQLAEQFLGALNEGKIPWQACWTQQLPANAVTGKRYRGVNALNLSFCAGARGYTDPRWCTYKQAREKGWQVRRGEKAASVEYWACYDTKQKKLLSWEDVRRMVTADPNYEANLFLSSRVYSVFNAEQIDGIPPLLAQPKVNLGAIRAQRDVLIRNMGIGYREGGNQAFYSPQSDCVTLPPEASFIDGYGYMATFLHECGHATGHPTRLNRDLSGGFASESYAREELRAEIASAFTAQSLGLALTQRQLAAHMDLHKAYIQHWATVLKDAPEELFRAIKAAEEISDYLIEKGEFTLQQATEQQTESSEKAAAFAVEHGMTVRQLTDQDRAAAQEDYRREANYEITYHGRRWYGKSATAQDLQNLANYAEIVEAHAVRDLQSPRDMLALSDQYPWANREQLAQITGGLRDGLTAEQVAVYAQSAYTAAQMHSIRYAQTAGLPDMQIAALSDPRFTPEQMDVIRSACQQHLSDEEIAGIANPEIPAREMLDQCWKIPAYRTALGEAHGCEGLSEDGAVIQTGREQDAAEPAWEMEP